MAGVIEGIEKIWARRWWLGLGAWKMIFVKFRGRGRKWVSRYIYSLPLCFASVRYTSAVKVMLVTARRPLLWLKLGVEGTCQCIAGS